MRMNCKHSAWAEPLCNQVKDKGCLMESAPGSGRACLSFMLYFWQGDEISLRISFRSSRGMMV